MAESLAAEQPDLDLRLAQSDPMFRRVMPVRRFRDQLPIISPRRATTALRRYELRLSMTRWMVSASG